MCFTNRTSPAPLPEVLAATLGGTTWQIVAESGRAWLMSGAARPCNAMQAGPLALMWAR